MASVATYLVMWSSLASYLVYIPHASSHYNYLYPIVCLQLRMPPQATRVACAAACPASTPHAAAGNPPLHAPPPIAPQPPVP